MRPERLLFPHFFRTILSPSHLAPRDLYYRRIEIHRTVNLFTVKPFSALPAPLLPLPNEYFRVCVWAIVPNLLNESGNMNHSHKSPQLHLSARTYSAIFCCPCHLLTRHFVCCWRTWWEVSWRLLACVIQCWLLFCWRIWWNSICYYCCWSPLESVLARLCGIVFWFL